MKRELEQKESEKNKVIKEIEGNLNESSKKLEKLNI